jgi:hypothetical protein
MKLDPGAAVADRGDMESTTSASLPERRTAPLALRVGRAEVILTARDVQELLDALDTLVVGLERELAADPASAVATVTALDAYARLRCDLLVAPWRLGADPLELDAGGMARLRSVLADLAGYQRGAVGAGLAALRDALRA